MSVPRRNRGDNDRGTRGRLARHGWFLACLLVVLGGALALRLPQLGLRPMHNDEGVNALKVQTLWEQGRFRYDPDEFHGPSLYYATLPSLWLRAPARFEEISEGTLRGVTVFFGVALIGLFWFWRDALGRGAALVAATLTAVSPAMVFYSRYYIHEMLLVTFTFLALTSAWRYARSRHPVWAALTGAGLGLMYATKETFVLELAAMAMAAALTWAWSAWGKPAAELGSVPAAAAPAFPAPPSWALRWNSQHFWIAVAAAVVVSGLLFTSFFTNLRGPLDSVLTYLPWTKRAGGHTAHLYPWYFYFERLFWYQQPRGPRWSEGFILLLAVVGLAAAFTGRGLRGMALGWIRFLGVYSVALAAIYSVISYKTPWCALVFFHGLILLAGVGAAALVNAARSRWIQAGLACALALGTGHLAWEAWRASFGEDRMGRLLAADRENPYVYSQTLPDVLELVEKVHGIARIHPDGRRMLIKVMSPEYLPLPWYFRDLDQVGWWGELPPDPWAPVMIFGSGLDSALPADRARQYYTSVYSLRENTFFTLYVEAPLWEAYVRSKSASGGR